MDQVTMDLRIWWVAIVFLAAAQPSNVYGESSNQEADAACLYRGQIEDGGSSLCIRRESFNGDLCSVLDKAAATAAIPPDFFARLIWRESLFRPEAVSPKGAEGIAQFMPATARIRGVRNSFDVIEALSASARYLAQLRERFGNLGLAAAAYNAGEAGLERFLKLQRLPIETRDYVFAITGHSVETWRDDPPQVAAPPLDPGRPFTESCLQLAHTRSMNEPVLLDSADWAPWGVQLAAHYNPTVANRLFGRAIDKLPAPLNTERALLVRQKGGNFGYRPRYAARIGRVSRDEATDLCQRIKAAGVPCTVFRN